MKAFHKGKKTYGQECRKELNLEQMRKHTIKCFSHVTYRTCVFDMTCVGTRKCDYTPFPSKPVNTILIYDEKDHFKQKLFFCPQGP